MRLIVQRQNGFNTGNDKGFVIPLAREDDNLRITPIQPDLFPNNQRIWISKDYQQIENEFGSDEIFYLNNPRDTWELKDNSQEEAERVQLEKQEIIDNPNKCRFFSLGYNASRIDPGYMPLVRLPYLPERNSGRFTSHLMPKLPAIGIQFFALVDDYVYGPFQVRRDIIAGVQDEIIFETVNRITPLSLQNNYIAKFSLKALEEENVLLRVTTSSTANMYITNLHIIKSKIPFESIDFISDSALINYFTRNDFFKENPLSKSSANSLRVAIETYVRKGHIAKTAKERVDRLVSIMSDFLEGDAQNYELVKRYLNSKDGANFLTEFLNKHESDILKDHIAQIREKNTKDLEELERQHDTSVKVLNSRLMSEKQTVERKIAKLHEDYANEQQKIEESKAKLNTVELSQEAEKLQVQISKYRSELGLLNDFSDLNSKLIRLDGRREGLDEDIKKKQAEFDNLKKAVAHQSNLLQNPQLLVDTAVGIETVKTIVNGVERKAAEEIYEITNLTPATINVVGETRTSYINYLQNEINNAGERPISYSETANLLVSVMQNYLTIFNGMPGVGKTSTVNNFADALKINVPGNRGNFLNVAVGRGWTSSKDLLGNKNALRGTYEEGRTGIYSMLKSMSACANEQEQAKVNHKMLSLILLDEANLSPMEHYWSDFLSICDTFHEGKSLNLGGRENKFTLDLPKSLRFIATINTDATVEPLSDRLLDRASVITLEYNDISSTESTLMENEIFNGAVPYEELAEAFMIDANKLNSIKDSGKLSSDIHIINEISNRFRKDIPNAPQIYISSRKTNAIYSYCAVANELDYQQISPVDFAIAQHILPKIKGHGKGFKERLQEVDTVLTDSRLHHSKRLLKQILDNGSDYADTYSLL